MNGDPEVLGAVIRGMETFAAARERDVRDNRDAPDNINEIIAVLIRGWVSRLDVARDSRPVGEGLDVGRVKQAVVNVALRHGIKADPVTPELMRVARIFGYSAAPADMDAEIAAEYGRLQAGPAAVRPATEPLCGCATAEVIDHFPSEHKTGVSAAVRPVEREGATDGD